jgi:hypothetical protein
MMNKMAGLLGSMPMGAQAPQGIPQGGLLARATPPGAPPQQQGQDEPMQMLMSLSQNPSPEIAKSIIMKLQSDQSPGAAQFVQVLTQAMNDPTMLKQIADVGLQKMSGAQSAGQ